MKETPIICPTETADYQTADEFLDALSPRGPYFGDDYYPDRYLFRGHADARFELLPSALRLGILIKTIARWTPVADWTNREQINAELNVLHDFFRLADHSGLSLPEDVQDTRGLFFSAQRHIVGYHTPYHIEKNWPPIQLWSMMALAQHYGMPTRLLDWSRSSYTAAYFAAIEAAEWVTGRKVAPEGVQSLAVWAFSEVAHTVNEQTGGRSAQGCSVELVTAPAASIPNLRAQKGVFTLCCPQEINPEGLVDRRPLDKVLQASLSVIEFHVFKLPVTEAPKLLRLLAKEGVSGAMLFPGYGGVATGLKEQQLWDAYIALREPGAD
jgi:hypothetical protein